MYEHIPCKTNKKAHYVIIILFAAAALLLLLSYLLEGMPFLWMIQLVAIVFLMAAVLIVTRYISKAYIYRIEESDRGRDLTVTEANSMGKRRITVCRISLSGISECTVIGSKDNTLKEVRKKTPRFYDYRADILPERSILLIATEGGEDFCVCLSYDEELFLMLCPEDKKENTNETGL